jgi:hypothetical protein
MVKKRNKKNLVHAPGNFLAGPHQEANTGRYTNNTNNVNKAIKTNNPNHATKKAKDEISLYEKSLSQVFEPNVYWLINYVTPNTTNNSQMEVQIYV